MAVTAQEAARARFTVLRGRALMQPMAPDLEHLLSRLLPPTPEVLPDDQVLSALKQMKVSVTNWGLAHQDEG
jgi:hypothetical protein